METSEVADNKGLFEGSLMDFLAEGHVYETEHGKKRIILRREAQSLIFQENGNECRIGADLQILARSIAGPQISEDDFCHLLSAIVRKEFDMSIMNRFPSNMTTSTKSGATPLSVTKTTNYAPVAGPRRIKNGIIAPQVKPVSSYSVIIGMEEPQSEGIIITLDNDCSVRDMAVQREREIDGKLIGYSPRGVEFLDILPTVYRILSSAEMNGNKTDVLPAIMQQICATQSVAGETTKITYLP